MQFDTREQFKMALRRLIDTELSIEAVRARICIGAQGGLRDCFEQIDWLNRGYITKSDVKRIIDKYKEHVSPATAEERSFPDSVEMEAMFRRFNRDK